MDERSESRGLKSIQNEFENFVFNEWRATDWTEKIHFYDRCGARYKLHDRNNASFDRSLFLSNAPRLGDIVKK